MTEYQFQCTIKDFADLHYLPMIHTPNEGYRSKITGFRLKRMGMLAGVADCFFLRGNDKYKGLWLELKIKPNKPTREQILFMSMVNSEGYLGEVCYDLDVAITIIKDFYGL